MRDRPISITPPSRIAVRFAPLVSIAPARVDEILDSTGGVRVRSEVKELVEIGEKPAATIAPRG